MCSSLHHSSEEGTHLEGAERLHGVGLDLGAGGLGLEHHLLTGEGVATHASLGGWLLLSDEAGHAGEDELAALLELGVADRLDGGEGSLGFVAGETRFSAQVVDQLGLVEVRALGLDGGEHLHGLGGLDLLGGDLLTNNEK